MRVVRLTASTPTLEARLRGRDSGHALEEHLSEFAQYAEVAAGLPADAEVMNGDRSIAEVAQEVLSKAGW